MVKTGTEVQREAVAMEAERGEGLEVKVTVQPPELFEDNKLLIEEVASTDAYNLVYRDNEYVIYDSNGKQQKLPEKFPLEILMNVTEIATKLKESNKTFFGHRPNFGYDKDRVFTVEEFFVLYGFRPVLAEMKSFEKYLDLEVVKRSDRHAYTMTDLTTAHAAWYTGKRARAKLSSSADEQWFVLEREGIIYTYHTTDDGGRALEPSHWQLVRFDSNKINQQVLSQYPWLREYAKIDKGRPIEGTKVAVSCERGILNAVNIEKNQRIFSDAAVGFVVDPNNPRIIHYLTNENEIKTIHADKLDLSQTESDIRKLPFTTAVKEFRLDRRGNFFLIITEENGKNRLKILEKDTLRVTAEVPEANEKLDIDSVGNIYFLDHEKRLRMANTNFSTFQKGGLEAARDAKKNRLLALQERLAKGLTLPAAGARAKGEQSEDEILRALGIKLEETFKSLIDKTASVADIDELRGQIEVMKQDAEWSEHPEVFVTVEDRLAAKESDMKTVQLRTDIHDFGEFLNGVHSLEDLIELERKFAVVQKNRRVVTIPDRALRKTIDDEIKSLDVKRVEVLQSQRTELEKGVELLLEEIKLLINDVGTIDELQSLSIDKKVLAFEQALTYSERDKAKAWKTHYKDLLSNRKKELKKLMEDDEEARRMKDAETLADADEFLLEISETMTKEIADPKEAGKWALRHPLITKYRQKIMGLSSDALRRGGEEKLTELLKEKQRDLEHRKVLNIPETGGEVDFGKAKFPVFKDVKRVWRPRILPIAEGSEYGSLVFEDNLGHIFRPKIGAVKMDMEDQDTKDVIEVYKKDANKYFESIKRDVPAYSEKWVLSQHFKDELSDIAALGKKQLENQKGILILEGEAGTGKNVMVDMFAHFTNHETFTFSCNFQTEKEDITYAFKFDAAKGTYTIDSRLIEMLQTPGSVIVLDEINTLPPGVTKMLNPLLDYRRALYLPDGRVIKADPTVLIIGTMNPQHYLGVKPLSQEVKSRARIKFVEYPPEKRGGQYAVDEAMVLAKYIDSLQGLKQEEFEPLWQYVINNDTAGGGDKFVDKEKRRLEDCKRLALIIKTANKVREAYRAFRTGKSADIIEFVFSMRESVDIASEINHIKDVKKAIKEVVLPKIGDPAERERVEIIVDNV